jgi:hypothetical protein
VAWAKRLRRVGLAWQNALEIMRAGRLTAPYGAPFEVVHQTPIFRLRRYASPTPSTAAPLLLVPPLMVASEVYDIAPDVSAVAYLTRAGMDVWLTDFGAPEREEGGMDRTLDDHIGAVSDAIDRVRARPATTCTSPATRRAACSATRPRRCGAARASSRSSRSARPGGHLPQRADGLNDALAGPLVSAAARPSKIRSTASRACPGS